MTGVLIRSKRTIAYILIVCLVSSLISFVCFIDTAYAADDYQYAYVISKPTVYLRMKGSTLEIKDNTGNWRTFNGQASVKTQFSNLRDLEWSNGKNEPFECVGWISASSSEVSRSGATYGGATGNPKPAPYYSLIEINTSIVHGKIFASGDLSGPPGSSGVYGVSISESAAMSAYKSSGKEEAQIAIISGFKYKSKNKIPSFGGGGGGGGDVDPPEPPPEPEYPSEARVRLSLSADNATMNYMNFSGTVGAEASARDRTNYEDYGDLKKVQVELEAFDDYDSDSSRSQGDTVTASLTGNLSKNANWLSGSGRQYYYRADAEAYVQLDDGDPDYAEESDSTKGYIELTNEEPSCSWNLQSSNYNGGSVPNGFYYVGVPAKLDIKFKDPENDISQVQMSIAGEKANAQGKVDVTYSKGDQGNQDFANSLITIENRSVSMDEYSATLTFTEPGIYHYTMYVADAKSNKDVWRSANGSGTFIVRSAPEPPTAIITSPSYAFENEPFKVTQGSTDPNGVDDIRVYKWTNAIDVTPETSPEDAGEGFTPITPSSNWPGNNSLSGKNGGTITFPTGSSHHNFKITLGVIDATNLSDNTEQVIRVISDVPVAQLTIPDNGGSKVVKENRKITVDASTSLAPAKSPIIWNECKWTVKSLDGKHEVNIHEDSSQRNGNKQRVLQFDKPGKYTVTVELVNSFSKQNPGHEDIGAATQTIMIEVIEDVVPESSVGVISAKPNFFDNPVEHTVTFGVNSNSIDGDKIIAPSDYSWLVYEDLNDDGRFTSDELVPQSKLTFNSEHTQVSMQTKFEKGRHNVIKAVVTTKETFAEPTISKFLASDGSYIRKTTVETTEVVNWVPKIVITPDQGPNTIPPTQYNPKPGTPYEDVDLDGDGVRDGKFIRAYTDDTFTVTTQITDEFPETAVVEWELQKKKHDGSYTRVDDTGSSWINSGKVTSTLGHDGGGCRIDSPGIYILKATVTDDCGDTGTFTVNARIYTLPKAVLESNPKYRFFNGEWITKENIRFDLRSDPTIVDDEWGVAWHRMNWDLDCWEITPQDGQKTNEIHVMTPTYGSRYSDTTPGTSKFTGKNSKLGGITGNSSNGNQPYRSLSFTEPGKYEFRYWGTNYGGKVTVPVKYIITVEEDLPPNIMGTVGATFYRDPDDRNRAKISLLGPYASILGREVLTIQSPDGDYIDYTIVEVIHDSNNNKLFTDNSDTKWLLEENKTTVNGLEYILKKIDPYA